MTAISILSEGRYYRGNLHGHSALSREPSVSAVNFYRDIYETYQRGAQKVAELYG